MRAYLGRALRAAVAAATVTLCGVVPAQASLYTGAWDPQFGTPFLGRPYVFPDTPPPLPAPQTWDLFWAGSYSVNAVCPVNGTLANCTPPSAGVALATVKLSQPAPGGASTTISFSPGSMTISDLVVSGDVITALKTDVSDWWSAPTTGDPSLDAALIGYEFALQFLINGAGSESLGFPVITGYSGPVLYARKLTTIEIGGEPVVVTITYRSDVEDYPPRFLGLTKEGAEVPEPGVVMLLAGALLAAGVTRRRLRSTQP